MTDAAIITVVKQVLIDHHDLGEGDFDEDLRFVEDLNFDSLDAIEMTMHLEDALDRSLSDQTVLRCRTVRDLIQAIDRETQ